MNSSERMAINSVILYVKLIITIVVNLIATRLILNAMGVVDYGVVNLISGIVSMLTFIQNSMAISTQRYMSVNIGKGDVRLQSIIFNNGLFLHLLLGIFIIIVLEACLPLVFNGEIQIPSNRLTPSIILYQLTCLGTFLVIICVPVDAVLNAHENMLWVSFASILESIIRLVGALWLLHYNDDKLVFYGLLVVVIRMSSMLFKTIYCRNKYEEVRIRKNEINKKLMKEMFSFSLWNMFGAFAMAMRGQGVAVVLNIFNGVIVNTAYGIAQQVSGQLNNFSGTISKSMSPQIMQREGGGDTKSMASLALKQCFYTTLCLFLFALPLYMEMPYVLKVWLKIVPEYSIDFCRIYLLIILVTQMSSGLMTAIQAKGKIAVYQITMSVILLLNIPIAYLLQKYGVKPSAVLWSMLIVEGGCLIARLISAKILVGITAKEYTNKVLARLLIVFVPTTIAVVLCKLYISDTWDPFGQLLISIVVTVVIASITAYLCFDNNERLLVRTFAKKIKDRMVSIF